MKWKNINRPLGVPILGTPFKCNGWLAAAAIAGNVLDRNMSQMYTRENNRQQSHLNKDEMAYSQALNKDYQTWLNNTQYGAQVSGMKNAGLNPAGNQSNIGAMQAGNSLHSGGHSGSTPSGSIDVAGALRSAKEMEVMDKEAELKEKQAENVDADTVKKQSESKNIDADTVIKQWQGSPTYKRLVENGLSADAAKAWAETGLSKEQATKCMKEVQLIGKQMNLTDAQVNYVQEQTAKLKSDIEVNMSQIQLNRAIAHAQKAVEAELYSRASLNEENAKLSGEYQKTEREKRDNLHNQTVLLQREEELTDTEKKIKDYMLDCMDNIDPNSLEGKIYSRLEKLGDLVGHALGSGTAVKVAKIKAASN